MGWRTLVVEDVTLMRDALVDALRSRKPIGIVDAADTLAEARAHLVRSRYDLLFLDVHLPDGEGVALGAESGGAAVVYCTADPGFAVDAFRQEAVDYLLKPVSGDALDATLERVRRRRSGNAAARPPIAVRDRATVRYIAVELVERVEAAGHYQCVHAGGEVYLLRQSSAQIMDALGPGFVRAHRSLLVRASAIRALTTERSGDGTLTLASGASVRFSRSFRDDLEAALRPT